MPVPHHLVCRPHQHHRHNPVLTRTSHEEDEDMTSSATAAHVPSPSSSTSTPPSITPTMGSTPLCVGSNSVSHLPNLTTLPPLRRTLFPNPHHGVCVAAGSVIMTLPSTATRRQPRQYTAAGTVGTEGGENVM
mmetsp:Transcript_2377/g.4936  ORF Transcript_2377/g.4936 Transcript_2377/m.4936 type:complete len:133 (+) Transcript_2377:140-538(+)